MVDLHTHSRASDGAFTPSELVARAAAEGLVAIALTDHDSVEGLAEGAEAAGKAGIRFVAGVEVEIAWAPGEFHLLGLDLRDPGGAVAGEAAGLAASRDERNRRVFALLREAGFDADYEGLRAVAGTGLIGRPHIAELMVARGYARSKQDAFDRYLAKGRPFYLPKDCLPLERALEVIRESGGLSIVAHPLSLFVSWTRMRSLMTEWKDMGVDGIEAWHPIARVADCVRLEDMGRAAGLRVTAGSDFHGPSRPDRRLGRTAGGRVIDDCYLESLAR